MLRSAAASAAPTLRRQKRTSQATSSSSDVICPATGDNGPTSDGHGADNRRRAQLDVLIGDLAGGDDLAEETGHVAAVGPAVDETLGVGG